jgi:hypothetical protein
MGVIKRLFGVPNSPDPAPAKPVSAQPFASPRMVAAEEVRTTAGEQGDVLVELDIVGEEPHQDVLARIAGPKEPEGKQKVVGVTLRCEPTNEYDRNAVSVEVMGLHVAYVARAQAALLCLPIADNCNGAIEARGLIVGGWDDGITEGHYGLRVWLTTRDTKRIGVEAERLDPSLRTRLELPKLPPVASGERRLSPTRGPIFTSQYGDEQAAYGSGVTVVAEEHYQAAILAAMPRGWDTRSWPLLVELDLVRDGNPHGKTATPCIGVRIGTERVGYFTNAMTERYASPIEAALAAGERPTAAATAYQGNKRGATFWRLRVDLGPAD